MVVDPQRDVDRLIALTGRLGVRISHVVETHVHNDYVSGGLELARLTGAAYVMSGADEVGFDRTAVANGDVLKVSAGLRLWVLATPGHTFHHLSYVLEGRDGVQGVFTGGSLLHGTTGRTDLLGGEHAEDPAQHASARTLADALPAYARVWPTHGFGSFCTAGPASGDDSTVGQEQQVKPVGTEWDTSHVRGAVHVPPPELPRRLGEVPDGVVWVHCGRGYRAAAAASLLARAGRTVVVIDDSYGDAENAGVPLTTDN